MFINECSPPAIGVEAERSRWLNRRTTPRS